MEQIFAPWRIEWVKRGERLTDAGECVFCSLREQTTDRENLLVARSEHAYVLLNNYPYNPGHVMVIPHRHTGDFSELSDPELLDHSRLTQRTLRAVDVAFSPDGFNTGFNIGKAAGGSISDHLHTHIVPRWVGDTNFMAVIGDTKIIVDALSETYTHLHRAFESQDGVVTDGSNVAAKVTSP